MGIVRCIDVMVVWLMFLKKLEEEASKGFFGRSSKKEKKEKKIEEDKLEEVVIVDEIVVNVIVVEEELFEFVGFDFEVKFWILIMIVGLVGCGKSTFVSAFNKFVTCKSGDIKVSGVVLFCV